MKLNKLLIKAAIFIASIYVIRLLLSIFIQPLQIYQLTVLPPDFFLFFKGEVLKVGLFASIAFIFFNRKKLAVLKNYASNFKSIIGFSLLTLLSIFLYYLTRYFIKLNLHYFTDHIIQATILVTIPLILFISFLFISIFNIKTLISFIKQFKYQIFTFSGLGVLYFFLIRAFQSLWPFFSKVVATLTEKLFSLFYSTNLIFSQRGPILTIENFKVIIGAPCSGIDSMLLFTTLFFLIFFLDHKKLNKTRALILFPIGLIGMFLFNILRIFVLLLTGLYISEQFAVGLFHQNIGWILFIIYFIFFYIITKRFIYKPL